MPEELLLDYYIPVDARTGRGACWSNIFLHPGGVPGHAVMHGVAVNIEPAGGLKHVRVSIILTFPPDAVIFTLILDRIEIYTYEGTLPPYPPPFSKCLIHPQPSLNINLKDQLDFQTTLLYPIPATAPQYMLNIKIYGNYEER